MSQNESNKTWHLQQSRTLNRSPQQVQDWKFEQQSYFFDAQDLLQVRYEMVRLVMVEECTLTEAARRFGYSKPTCFRMTKAFKQGGLQALIPAPPGPKRASKVSDEIVRFALDYRARYGRIGAGRLVPIIEQKFKVKIHPRSLEKALVRYKKKLQASAQGVAVDEGC